MEWPSPAMVTPIKTMRMGDSPPAVAATENTSRLVSSAPSAAASDSPISEETPSTALATTTASDAPALSPSVSGDAMRLRDKRLHQNAGNPQRPAHQRRDDRARQAQIGDHHRCFGIVEGEQRLPHLAQRIDLVAQCQACQHHASSTTASPA